MGKGLKKPKGTKPGTSKIHTALIALVASHAKDLSKPSWRSPLKEPNQKFHTEHPSCCTHARPLCVLKYSSIRGFHLDPKQNSNKKELKIGQGEEVMPCGFKRIRNKSPQPTMMLAEVIVGGVIYNYNTLRNNRADFLPRHVKIEDAQKLRPVHPQN